MQTEELNLTRQRLTKVGRGVQWTRWAKIGDVTLFGFFLVWMNLLQRMLLPWRKHMPWFLSKAVSRNPGLSLRASVSPAETTRPSGELAALKERSEGSKQMLPSPSSHLLFLSLPYLLLPPASSQLSPLGPFCQCRARQWRVLLGFIWPWLLPWYTHLLAMWGVTYAP